MLDHLPEGRQRDEAAVDVRLAFRSSLVPMNDWARIYEILGAAEPMARRLGDPRRLGRVLAFLAHHAWATVDYRQAIDLGRRAQAIAAEGGDEALQIAVNQVVAQTHHDLADYESAVALCERNLALLGDRSAERFGLPVRPAVTSRQTLAWCLAWQGRFDRAVPVAVDALAAAADHPASVASAHNCAGLTYLLKTDLAAAVPLLEHGTELYRSLHFRNPAILSFLAHAYALAGRVEESFVLFEESLNLAARVKFLPCNSLWVFWWGEAHLLAGRAAEAMDLAVRALNLARAQREPAYEAYALQLVGEITADRDPRAAEPRYREALSLAERLGMRPLVGRCHLRLRALARAIGHREEAERHLQTSSSLFREMGMPLWLARAEAAAG